MILTYFVELFELDSDAQQKKIATFRLSEESAEVKIDGDERHPVLQNIQFEGIFDYKYSRPGKLYPYDGMYFLENLKYHFRSGYLLATDVERRVVDTER